MSDFQTKYGTSNQSLTCTVTSLANATFRSSVAVDNSSTKYLDVLVSLKIKTNSSGTDAAGYVNVYAFCSTDGGTEYGGGESNMGTDATVTLASPPNIPLIGSLTANANGTEYMRSGMSIAAAFGGSMPERWGIVVENRSAATLDASVGAANYQGIEREVV